MPSPRSSQNQKSSSFPVRFAKSALFQIFVFFTTVIVLGVAYASWTTLNVSQGADGQPVTQTLMQGIINNLNDLQARMTAVESSSTTLKIWTSGPTPSSDRIISCKTVGTQLWFAAREPGIVLTYNGAVPYPYYESGVSGDNRCDALLYY